MLHNATFFATCLAMLEKEIYCKFRRHITRCNTSCNLQSLENKLHGIVEDSCRAARLYCVTRPLCNLSCNIFWLAVTGVTRCNVPCNLSCNAGKKSIASSEDILQGATRAATCSLLKTNCTESLQTAAGQRDCSM